MKPLHERNCVELHVPQPPEANNEAYTVLLQAQRLYMYHCEVDDGAAGLSTFTNVTASAQAYQGLLHSEDVHLFVAAS